MNDFFATLYELLINVDHFSNEMYNNLWYIPIGLCMILIPIVLLTLYYYVINSTRFSKGWHWLVLVIITCAINFIISYSISFHGLSSIFGDHVDGLHVYCLSLSLINMIWSFLVSFIWSMIIKWKSSNCRRTPF